MCDIFVIFSRFSKIILIIFIIRIWIHAFDTNLYTWRCFRGFESRYEKKELQEIGANESTTNPPTPSEWNRYSQNSARSWYISIILDRQPRVGGAKICRVGNCRIVEERRLQGPISGRARGPSLFLPLRRSINKINSGPRFSSPGPVRLRRVPNTSQNTRRRLLLTASLNHRPRRSTLPTFKSSINSARRKLRPGWISKRDASLLSATWKSACVRAAN